MRSLILIYFAAFLTGFSPARQESEVPDRLQLVRYYTGKLDHPYSLIRIEGIIGLGHFATASSSDAISKLLERTKTDADFERLTALWALYRINTSAGRSIIEENIRKEKGKLLEGSFSTVAARTAFLAAVTENPRSPSFLDRALPPLYNKARDGDLQDQLLASWALYQIDTPVTRQTADNALKQVASALDPEHPGYTRYLSFLTFLGPPAKSIFSDKLEELIASHKFEIGLVSKKARTVNALAFLYYPDEPEILEKYRDDLIEHLNSVLLDESALSDMKEAGPFVCSDRIVSAIKRTQLDKKDPSERKQAGEILLMCSN